MKRCVAVFFLAALGLSAQLVKEAPPISAPPLDVSQPFTGWNAFRGNIVIVDFWATWCGPCIAGLDKIAKFEKDFAGQPVRFLTVALDETPRVKQYFAEKGFALRTFVEGTDRKTSAAFGIHGIPAAAIIDRQGRLMAVTSGENVTAEVIRKLLNDEKVDLPPYERPNNLTWDQDEVLWQDGVQPEFLVVFKPMKVSCGGLSYQPGSNHISGDGCCVYPMIQAAWQTDEFASGLARQNARTAYRFGATVPKGRESELLPTLQDAIQRNFGLRIHWDNQERDALVLSRLPSPNLRESEAAEPHFMFLPWQNHHEETDCFETGRGAPQLDAQTCHRRNGPHRPLRFRTRIPRRRSRHAPRRPEREVRPGAHFSQTHHQDVSHRAEVGSIRTRTSMFSGRLI